MNIFVCRWNLQLHTRKWTNNLMTMYRDSRNCMRSRNPLEYIHRRPRLRGTAKLKVWMIINWIMVILYSNLLSYWICISEFHEYFKEQVKLTTERHRIQPYGENHYFWSDVCRRPRWIEWKHNNIISVNTDRCKRHNGHLLNKGKEIFSCCCWFSRNNYRKVLIHVLIK